MMVPKRQYYTIYMYSMFWYFEILIYWYLIILLKNLISSAHISGEAFIEKLSNLYYLLFKIIFILLNSNLDNIYIYIANI